MDLQERYVLLLLYSDIMHAPIPMLDWIGPGCSHCSHMVALCDRICIVPTGKTCALI